MDPRDIMDSIARLVRETVPETGHPRSVCFLVCTASRLRIGSTSIDHTVLRCYPRWNSWTILRYYRNISGASGERSNWHPTLNRVFLPHCTLSSHRELWRCV